MSESMSAKEIMMRAVGNAIATAIRAVQTMPNRGTKPLYVLGWQECKAMAEGRLHAVLQMSLKELDKQIPEEKKPCQEQQPQ